MGGNILIVSNQSLTKDVAFELSCTEYGRCNKITGVIPPNRIKTIRARPFGGLVMGGRSHGELCGYLRQAGENCEVEFRTLPDGRLQIKDSKGVKAVEPIKCSFPFKRTEALREKDFWSVDMKGRNHFIEMALLASSAYAGGTVPPGYKLMDDIGRNDVSSGCLRCRLMRSKDNTKWVFSFPGVDFGSEETLFDDLNFAMMLKSCRKQERIDEAVKLIEDTMRRCPDKKYYLVGHSLGGAMVQQILSELAVTNDVTGITFNAYGCKPMRAFCYPLIQVHLDRDPVFSIDQSWHCGELYSVPTPGEVASVIECHKLDVLISAMRSKAGDKSNEPGRNPLAQLRRCVTPPAIRAVQEMKKFLRKKREGCHEWYD